MNRIRRLAVLSLFIALSGITGLLAAQETATVTLSLPSDFFQRACPSPLWNGLPVQWLGTTDRRPSPEVGLESKKEGKDPIAVLAAPPPAEAFDSALRGLFEHCGMKIVPTAGWRMAATIEEFHAGVEKGLIFGKGKAKSRITVTAESENRKLGASGGYELEFKKTRQKSLRRLTETLNELFAKTLEQLPKSTQLRSMQP
ncbi:MAG TPA: YajG family lipoprotein [bacterium]|nr:YajG family lipoprotein [bacterium]